MTIRSKALLFLSVLALSCSEPVETKKYNTPQAPNVDAFPPTPCPGQFFCFASHNFESVQYAALNHFPAAFGASTSLGDKVFFGGGHEEGSIGFAMGDVNVFSATNGERHVNLSTPRSHLAAASAGDKVLFAGGTNIATMIPRYGTPVLKYYDIVDIYDGESLSLEVGHLSEKRGYMASVSTDTKAYFIGGKTLDGYSTKMDVYDAASGSWTVVEMPTSRAHSGAVSVGDKIYVCGGNNGVEDLRVMDVYNTTTGEWSSFQTPHVHPIATAVVLGDRIFIAGGDGSSTNAVDIFNTVDSTWSSGNLSDSRYHIAAAKAGNKIVFFGGAFSRNVDVYDGLSNTWSVATLSDGVTGVVGSSALGQCFFTGFLYDKGNAITNSMIIIRP